MIKIYVKNSFIFVEEGDVRLRFLVTESKYKVSEDTDSYILSEETSDQFIERKISEGFIGADGGIYSTSEQIEEFFSVIIS